MPVRPSGTRVLRFCLRQNLFVSVLVDSMRAVWDGPTPSLAQTLTSAYRKSLVTAASLLFSNSDDADAAGVPPAPAPRAPRGSVPAFAQRTPAEKLLGEALNLAFDLKRVERHHVMLFWTREIQRGDTKGETQ
jgi:hypothetical protein